MEDTSPTKSKRAQKCELCEMFLIINVEDFMGILSAPNVTKSNTESRLVQIKSSTKLAKSVPLKIQLNPTCSSLFWSYLRVI